MQRIGKKWWREAEEEGKKIPLFNQPLMRSEKRFDTKRRKKIVRKGEWKMRSQWEGREKKKRRKSEEREREKSCQIKNGKKDGK